MSSVTIKLEGQERLAAELRRKTRGELRAVARRVTAKAMKPLIAISKSMVPQKTGRLSASIGQLSSSNGRKTAFSSRVGVRRDFTYTANPTDDDVILNDGKGRKTSSGRANKKLLAKGFVQDKTSAQLYAGGIHFGTDKKGRVRRKAGAVQFLERPIVSNTAAIISTVSAELRAYLESN